MKKKQQLRPCGCEVGMLMCAIYRQEMIKFLRIQVVSVKVFYLMKTQVMTATLKNNSQK